VVHSWIYCGPVCADVGLPVLAPDSNKRLKNEEADDDSLEEKENCVKFMITLASRDQPCEIKRAADKIYRPQGKKVRNAF
jgi:hypothetical protein